MLDVKYVPFREPVLGLLSPDFVYVYINRIETNYPVCRLYHYSQDMGLVSGLAQSDKVGSYSPPVPDSILGTGFLTDLCTPLLSEHFIYTKIWCNDTLVYL